MEIYGETKISYGPTSEPIFSGTNRKILQSLTHFGSLSSADRYGAVCFVVGDNAEAGNSAK